MNVFFFVQVKAYGCLEQAEDSDDADDLLGVPSYSKVCKKLPGTIKCLKPFLTTLEQCFSSEIFKLEGVITEGLVSILKPFCSNDKAFTKGNFQYQLLNNHGIALLFFLDKTTL